MGLRSWWTGVKRATVTVFDPEICRFLRNVAVKNPFSLTKEHWCTSSVYEFVYQCSAEHLEVSLRYDAINKSWKAMVWSGEIGKYLYLERDLTTGGATMNGLLNLFSRDVQQKLDAAIDKKENGSVWHQTKMAELKKKYLEG